MFFKNLLLKKIRSEKASSDIVVSSMFKSWSLWYSWNAMGYGVVFKHEGVKIVVFNLILKNQSVRKFVAFLEAS